MANHSLPTLTSSYTNFLSEVSARIEDALKFGRSDTVTLTNPPVGTIRWNATSFIWEQNTGTVGAPVWTALASSYGITITGSAAKWTTARTITLGTDLTGNVSLDGSANVTLNATLNTVTAAKGGTGQTSYAVGDLLYANTTTSLAKLADVATGNALLSGGVGVAPNWGKVGLTTHITGTLAVENGGTGVSTLSGVAYGNGTGAFTAANAAQIVSAIGTTAVTNATNAVNATNATNATTAASCSGNSATATNAAAAIKLSFQDLRATSITPSYFGAVLSTAFMQNSTDGLSDGGTYHGVIHYQQYSDASGGGSHQMGFTDNNNVWHRGSSGALTSWASWRLFLDSTNYTAYAVPITGTTGAATMPVGTTAQRPTPATGHLRFNTTLSQFEGYNGSAWGKVGGGATGGGTDDVFVENGQTVNTNYTLTSGKNAMSAGPITIASGITVTIPSGSNWAIV